jgi:hypothetical protein
MTRLAFAAAAIALAVFAAPAEAHKGRYHKHHHHHNAGKVHYGGKPGLGYWRRGPEQGRGFGFSSYKGDPFGSDDYYDGNRCFYVRHRDHCVKNNIFSGFNWPYVRRY